MFHNLFSYIYYRNCGTEVTACTVEVHLISELTTFSMFPIATDIGNVY